MQKEMMCPECYSRQIGEVTSLSPTSQIYDKLMQCDECKKVWTERWDSTERKFLID